jgi:radical SAM superfamily enzyme YgiQ (UPF0313 family)
MAKKIRILLVYPNIPMMLVTPLSIALFTWICRQEGFEVHLFDATQYGDGDLSSPQKRVKYLQAREIFSEENLRLLKRTEMASDFLQKLESLQPDLLLYSFTEDALSRALQLLGISQAFKIPTVVGGVLATAAPEWLISFPEINMLSVGEGEEVVRDLALRLSQGQDYSDLPNLWIKQADGTIIRNPLRPYVNLDDYSTDFSIFDENRFVRPMGGKIHRALPIETYRGCPNRCTYCNSPMHNRIARQHNRVYWRRRSIESIRREVTNLIDNYQVNLLYIIDDDFLARPRREIDAFIDMYQEFRLPFWFNTRPERCTADLLQRLKEVGLFRASFGIESGNEEFRIKHLGRNISNEKLLHYFAIIHESGIQYSINCIIGFPFETRAMVFDTIRLVKQVKGYDAVTVSIYTPYRGTLLRQQAIDAGWLDPEALTIHTTASSMLKMPHFTANQIDGLMRTFPLYVEFDESAWPEIEQAELFEPEGEANLEKYASIYRQRRWGAQ